MIYYLQIAVSLGLEGVVREGVYTMVGGPNYETIAELKMLRDQAGVDSVGQRKEVLLSSQLIVFMSAMTVNSKLSGLLEYLYIGKITGVSVYTLNCWSLCIA